MRSVILAPAALALAACGEMRTSCCDGIAVLLDDDVCFGDRLSCDILKTEIYQDTVSALLAYAEAETFIACSPAVSGDVTNCRDAAVGQYRAALEVVEVDLQRLRTQRAVN